MAVTLSLMVVVMLGASPAGSSRAGGGAQSEPSSAAPPSPGGNEPAIGSPEDAGPGASLHDPESWRVRFEPAFWYVAPRGDVTLPGDVGPVEFEGATLSSSADVDLSDLDADDPGAGFFGRLGVERGRWGGWLGFGTVGTSGDTTAGGSGRVGDAFFAEGDGLDSSFDFWSLEATASYAIMTGPDPGEPGDARRLAYRVELMGGLRVQNVDFALDVTPGAGARPSELGLSAQDDETFVHPIVGARLRLHLFEEFEIEAGGSVGYFTWSGSQTSSSWDVLAALTWRPVANVGVIFGYRFLGLSGDSGDGDDTFEFRGSSAGLFGGVAVAF